MEMTKPSTDKQDAPQTTPPQVNDITAPMNSSTAEAAPAAPATDTPASEAPASAKEEMATPPAEDAKTDEPAEAQVAAPAQPVTPKKHGAGAAIFAAVVVVLALGAMFTYAYLQSQ
jgi:hypothetical protein